MKTYYDCIPCFVRQTLDAVRFASSNENIHEFVIREVLSALSWMNLKKSPPAMGQRIHRIIRSLSGCEDPYKELKDRFNQYALELYPQLKEITNKSSENIDTAARIAVAGNIIDFGANINVENAVVNETIEMSLSEPFFGNIDRFSTAVDSAEQILYVGDNSGEIVFDRLLIEQLPLEKVTFAVRGKPIINDVTMSDAIDTGMRDIVKVIDNGSDAPGTIIEECSETFRKIFFDVDFVIAKGQGNYETLSDVDQNIFFLLKAKCPVIAQHIGCDLGSFVIGRVDDF